MDKDKKFPGTPGLTSDAQTARGSQRMSDGRNAEMEELYRRLEPELRRTKPNPEAIAAALEAAQRLAAESDAEHAADDVAEELSGDTELCQVCGHHNRPGNKFCAMCGSPVAGSDEAAFPGGGGRPPSRALALPSNPSLSAAPLAPVGNRLETHHYHHHYHHHYFPGGGDAGVPRGGAPDTVREEKLRPSAALRGDMSRAEAAVRRITQEWVLACNTKHLDDLLDLYVADAFVLRSNFPPVRGAAAVREFFFGALDAGLGEVEMEPLRVEVVGDLAYEAGRCKALVPSASGKRREDRGKYLWVCARQSSGEWKLTADCWSSDLGFSMLESDVPASGGVKTSQPRKNP